MRMTRVALIGIVLCEISFGFCDTARALSGRYLGSFVHVKTDTTANRMRHYYDVGTRTATPGGLDLSLRMNLQYESQPAGLQGMSIGEWLNSVSDSDILRSRFNGDLRGATWRIRGQVVPWQRLNSDSTIPRKRDLQMGFDWAPRRYPSLKVNVTRSDRETEIGHSQSEDRRAELSYNRGLLGSSVSVRRLQRTLAGRNPTTATTDEFRAGLRGNTNVHGVQVSGSYDALVTDYQSRDRVRDQHTQSLTGSSSWNPSRKLSLSLNSFTRWGKVTDNALREPREIAETSVGASAGYRPYTGLSFDVTRDYRRQKSTSGDIVSDYLRLQSLYRRALVRRVSLHTGYLQTLDLKSERGSVPNSSVFAFLDGELRKGISARAELQASRSASSTDVGTQWRRLLQLRTLPTRTTRFEVLWRRDTLPRIQGAHQRDRTLELSASYEPTGAAGLVLSYRRLDGEGRIQRGERFWSYNASWRTSQRTLLSFHGSHRSARLQSFETTQGTLGADLTFWMAQEYKVQANWRRITFEGEPQTRSYGITLTRDF